MRTLEPGVDINSHETTINLRSALATHAEEPVRNFLIDILDSIEEGKSVSLVSSDKSGALSAADAADLLGISRPTLYKLLDLGSMPFHKVGTHRRIKLDDLQRYIEQREIDRKRFAEDIAMAHRSEREKLAEAAGVDTEELRSLGY
ncbi:hypothetical protein NYA9BBAC_02047 [Salinibacterium sp. NYA9b]